MPALPLGIPFGKSVATEISMAIGHAKGLCGFVRKRVGTMRTKRKGARRGALSDRRSD